MSSTKSVYFRGIHIMDGLQQELEMTKRLKDW